MNEGCIKDLKFLEFVLPLLSVVRNLATPGTSAKKYESLLGDIQKNVSNLSISIVLFVVFLLRRFELSSHLEENLRAEILQRLEGVENEAEFGADLNNCDWFYSNYMRMLADCKSTHHNWRH